MCRAWRISPMKFLLLSLCALLSLSLSIELMAMPTLPVADRQIAITIDDLPAAASSAMTGAAIVQMTAKLLAALQQERVPAVGFVNERKLYHKWGEVDERIGLRVLFPVEARQAATLSLDRKSTRLN